MRFRMLCLLLLCAFPALATDPSCPAYPAAQRSAFLLTEAKLKAFRAFSAARDRRGRRLNAATLAPEDNLIDRYIFGKMQADGVEPAPRSEDSEFLRRTYLDLTGRLATADQAVAF